MKLKFCALVSGIALFVSLPAANAQIYRATLVGANEIPAINTPGTGSGIITLNRNTHEMRVRASFSGLIGTTTQSHVHCCVVQPGNAGVATTTPTFVGFPLGVTSGSWDRLYDMSQSSFWNPAFLNANGATAASAETAFATGVAAGQSYLNIHSSFAPGGEIRGTLQLFQFVANPVMTSGIAGVAGALDSLGAGTGSLNDALVNLAGLTPDQLAANLARLTPSSSRGRLAVTTGDFDGNFNLIGRRLDGPRWADRNQKLQGSMGIWGGGHALTGRQFRDSGFDGFDRDGWNLIGGVDHRLHSGTFIGGAIGYSDSDLNYRDQSSGNRDDIRDTQLSFYVGKDIGRFFVQGAAGYAWQNYDSSRDTGVTGTATASFDGRQWGARATFGVPIGTSKGSFTPQASLTWSNDKQDGYSETGGGTLGLKVAEKSVDRFSTSLGGQFDFGGDKLRPFLGGFWNRNYDSKERDPEATFLVGGTTFRTPGQKLAPNEISMRAGVNVFTAGAFSAGFDYDLTLGDASQLSVFQGRMHWNF